MELEAFQQEVREWVEANFPSSLANRGSEVLGGGEGAAKLSGEAETWRKALADQGWGAPTWPKEYGGAGLSPSEARVIRQELKRVGAFNPIPVITGMGITMIGPTILDYGTDDQKARHLPGIASGEVRWCVGYSEPNAGSDLASLQTRAIDEGDQWRVNGQKTWTSGANISQWCGALMRTDPSAPKRQGISFIMLPMEQDGVETRPIKLIAGSSPFCETFFTDAVARKDDLLGPLNGGWSVGKRLLQHERASQTGDEPVTSNAMAESKTLQDLAKEYVGTDENGKLADHDLRMRIARNLMHTQAHGMTLGRMVAEARGSGEVSAVASILKNSATTAQQTESELTLEIMGHNGIGWSGEHFNETEIESVRTMLWKKAMSIYGGTQEVQKNIISKNILGLPETTQKG